VAPSAGLPVIVIGTHATGEYYDARLEVLELP
jgi:hypothetical protein